MWNATLFGIESYKMILWFLTYSILGWIVELIDMLNCNRKLTNRGFAKGPICPIYGVGALTVFVILKPYSHNMLLLFLFGSILATTLEYVTAIIMNKMFGEIWWYYIQINLLITKGFFVWRVQLHGGSIQLSFSHFYMDL